MKLMPTVRPQMTGLDPDKESIMSVCCFVTDANLSLLDETGYEAIIHHDKARLDQMDAWCTNTHASTGLTAACVASETTAEKAAEGLLGFINDFVKEPRRGLLAGNSVHCDKAFLSRGAWKKVNEHLGYRILDVSSIKEAARRWAPQDLLENVPLKRTEHKAREDILESIEEARYWREQLFVKEQRRG